MISVRQSVLLPSSGPAAPTVGPILLNKRNSFPNVPIINRSNPLTKGLPLCVVPIAGGFVDLVTGMLAPQPSTISFRKTVRQQDPILPYAKYNSTPAYFPARTLLDNHTGPYTLFIDSCLETNATFATILSSYDSTNGIGMHLFIDDALTVVNTFVLSSFNTGHQNAGSVLGTNSEQFSHRLMVTADGSNWKFYAANQLVRTLGYSELPGTSSLRQTYVNNGGSSRVIVAWNRPLSLLEYSSLYNNPYQLFSTSTPHLWGNI
ncbi:MAG: hypothetical protein BWY21_00132 [Parcubacteria group bacterium ADurb.Bin216]|nr:MAG: hypothetical protein BWY21_00132 [Parcubacteria group bacterium ADurb.Bin216]